MKKTIAAAIAAITFAGTANAATLSLSTRVGENLVTYAKSDDENDENDASEEKGGCGGCGSSAAISAIAIVAVIGTAAVIKKKED